MTSSCALEPHGGRHLACGQSLSRPEMVRLWRVRSGVLGVLHGHADADLGPQFLAMPGDVIGIESALAQPRPRQIVAVVPTLIEPESSTAGVSPAAIDWAEVYAQARRQGREMLQLRSGPVADRVKLLLLSLGRACEAGDDGEGTDIELPSLRLLADIVDASPEAVCRVIGQLRRLKLVDSRGIRRVRVAADALSALMSPPGMTSSIAARRAAATAARVSA